jgi:hypothetical protein
VTILLRSTVQQIQSVYLQDEWKALPPLTINYGLRYDHYIEATRRRLAAHPQALNAVLQTARALGRSPDTVSVREVTEFGGLN